MFPLGPSPFAFHRFLPLCFLWAHHFTTRRTDKSLSNYTYVCIYVSIYVYIFFFRSFFLVLCVHIHVYILLYVFWMPICAYFHKHTKRRTMTYLFFMYIYSLLYSPLHLAYTIHISHCNVNKRYISLYRFCFHLFLVCYILRTFTPFSPNTLHATPLHSTTQIFALQELLCPQFQLSTKKHISTISSCVLHKLAHSSVLHLF
jgi:hypothetical protein